ncbi:MAG: CopG family transcriptional regulator [Actinomycetota bacterium]
MAKAEGYDKLSITVPRSLAREVRRRAKEGGLSAFATKAMRHELERERLSAFLGQLEEKFGPVDEREVAEVEAL